MISEHLQIVTKVKKQVMWPVHWWVISKICHYFFNQSYVLSNMREAGTSGLCSRKKTSYKIPLRFKLITDSTAVKPHLTAYHMAHLYVSMTIKQSNVIVFFFLIFEFLRCLRPAALYRLWLEVFSPKIPELRQGEHQQHRVVTMTDATADGGW